MPKPTLFKICIGKNVKKARKAAGYTQQQLADMLGIKKGRICRLETGQTMVVAILLYYISEALNTPIENFLIGLPGYSPDFHTPAPLSETVSGKKAPGLIKESSQDFYGDKELSNLIGRLSNKEQQFLITTLRNYIKTCKH